MFRRRRHACAAAAAALLFFRRRCLPDAYFVFFFPRCFIRRHYADALFRRDDALLLITPLAMMPLFDAMLFILMLPLRDFADTCYYMHMLIRFMLLLLPLDAAAAAIIDAAMLFRRC